MSVVRAQLPGVLALRQACLRGDLDASIPLALFDHEPDRLHLVGNSGGDFADVVFQLIGPPYAGER